MLSSTTTPATGLERRGPASVQTETSNTINLTLSVPAPSGGDANDYEYSVVVTPKKIRPRGPQVDAAGPPIPAPSFGCPISHNCPTKATTQGGTNSYGRKAKAWYVITKGLAIGVFYEFWADLVPYVKGYQVKGKVTSWCKAASEEEAHAIFHAAVKDGKTMQYN